MTLISRQTPQIIKRTLLFFTAFAVMCLGCTSALASELSGFSVSPLKQDIDVRPGGQAKVQIKVTNNSSSISSFTFSVVDIGGSKSEPAATPILFEGKVDTNISGYDWVTPPTGIQVPAGASRNVTATVSAPADAKGGHYAALVVSGSAADLGAANVASRIAVPLLMNAGGVLPPEINITEVKEYKKKTEVRYINSGKTHTTPKGTITYRDPVTGKVIKRSRGKCSTALPGSSGFCTFNNSGSTVEGSNKSGSGRGLGGFAGVGPTNGFVELVTDEGARARGDLPTEWAGSWTGMLLPLIGIALFIMYFLFLYRRRRAEKKALAEELDFDDTAYSAG